MSLSSLKAKALQNHEVKKEYDDLKEEFELISSLISMREKSGLTQQEIAEKMGTKTPNVSRLESGKGNPTYKTLVRYAKACGFNLEMSFTHA